MNVYIGIGKISNFFKNKLLHDVLDGAPAKILMIFFCRVNIFALLEELRQKIIPYFVTELKNAK
jgi:hypothetical protein